MKRTLFIFITLFSLIASQQAMAFIHLLTVGRDIQPVNPPDIRARVINAQAKIDALSNSQHQNSRQMRLNEIIQEHQGCTGYHCDQYIANERARGASDSILELNRELDTQLRRQTGSLALDTAGEGAILQTPGGSVHIPAPGTNGLIAIPAISNIVTALTGLGIDLVANNSNEDTADTRENNTSCDGTTGVWSGTTPFLGGCVRWGANSSIPLNTINYVKRSYNTIPELIDAVKPENLENAFAGFNPATPHADAKLFLDGVPVDALYTYTDANGVRTKTASFTFTDSDGVSQNLTLNSNGDVPAASATNNSKASQTSSDSLGSQLDSFFKTSAGTQFLSSLLRATISEAPYSPVAGNPASYMSQLVNNDYALANRVNTPNGGVEGSGMFSVVPGFSTMLLGDQAVQMYNLPMTYTRFIDNNDTLQFDMPIGWTKYGKTNSYNFALGFGWKHNIKPSWSITPAFHAGIEGSIDLTNGTLLYDASLTNHILLAQVDRITMGLTDNLSWLKTGGLNVGGYKAAFDIDNLITKNGVSFNYQFEKPMSAGLYYQRADVISGQKWFMSSFNEVGYTMSKQGVDVHRNGNVLHNSFTTKVSYMFGPKKASGVMSSFILNF